MTDTPDDIAARRQRIATVHSEGPYPCRWGGCNGSGVVTCDRCGSPVSKPRGNPGLVTRATIATADLLKLATDPPDCFTPSIFVKNLGGDIVEVSFPLTGPIVDRIAAFVAQMQPPTDEEIAEATARHAEEADAQTAVIEAAIAWSRTDIFKPERERLARHAIVTAVDNLLTIRAARRGNGEG